MVWGRILVWEGVKQRAEAVIRCYMRICPQEHGAGYQSPEWEDEGMNHLLDDARITRLSTDICGMSVVCMGTELGRVTVFD